MLVRYGRRVGRRSTAVVFPLVPIDPSPHHYTPSTMRRDLLNATKGRLFCPLSVNTLSAINCEQTVLAFINEEDPLPVTWLPTSYSQGPVSNSDDDWVCKPLFQAPRSRLTFVCRLTLYTKAFASIGTHRVLPL